MSLLAHAMAGFDRWFQEPDRIGWRDAMMVAAASAAAASVCYAGLYLSVFVALVGVGPAPWNTWPFEMIAVLLTAGALIGLLLSAPGLCFRLTRPAATLLLAASGAPLIFLPMLLAADPIRTLGLRMALDRAEPVISAIGKYRSDHGHPPTSLSQLTPTYLDRWPSRIPAFELVTGEIAREEFGGNDWALVFEMREGLVHEGVLVYVPDCRYERVNYNAIHGHATRLGGWAYQRN